MKTVVITGTSRGIGHALANKFLEEGYHVIGTSTSGESKINDPNFNNIKLDLSDSNSILKATGLIKSKYPKVDILINNAGISLEDWGEVNIDMNKLRDTLEVNLLGTIDFTEHLLPNISSKGQIINISSIMGSLSENYGDNIADNPSYRISKTALNMYTKTLASRLKKKDITISSVHPGWVKTDMGGEEAPRQPKEAADEIFKLAITTHETGLFWYDNKQIDWQQNIKFPPNFLDSLKAGSDSEVFGVLIQPMVDRIFIKR